MINKHALFLLGVLLSAVTLGSCVSSSKGALPEPAEVRAHWQSDYTLSPKYFTYQRDEEVLFFPDKTNKSLRLTFLMDLVQIADEKEQNFLMRFLFLKYRHSSYIC